MAGKFLSLEEVARQLGVTVDEVNRLVDRKKLFPMRDGGTVKFKADDVGRVARDMGDATEQSDDLALDLDLPGAAAGGDDDLSLGDPLTGVESIFTGDPQSARGGSQTIVRGDAGQAGSGLSISGIGDDEAVFHSQIGGSSPAAPGHPPASGPAVGSAAGSGLTIDLGDGSGDLGSLAGLSMASGAGAALSGALDSGLSLEGDAPQLSGISGRSAIDAAASLAGGASGLGADEFQLGSDTAEDESASVVIATEETGDSSFFGAAIEGEGSNFSEDLADGASVIIGEAGLPGEYALETPFSGWQIAGLVCCSLLLLCGGFMMYDLVRTIGSPEGPSLANPLLNAMAETFGWR